MLMDWLRDVYKTSGWLATLIIVVVVVVLTAGIAWMFGIDIGDIARWISML